MARVSFEDVTHQHINGLNRGDALHHVDHGLPNGRYPTNDKRSHDVLSREIDKQNHHRRRASLWPSAQLTGGDSSEAVPQGKLFVNSKRMSSGKTNMNSIYARRQSSVRFLGVHPHPTGDDSKTTAGSVHSREELLRARTRSMHDTNSRGSRNQWRMLSQRWRNLGGQQSSMDDVRRTSIASGGPTINKEKCLRKFQTWGAVVAHLMRLQKCANSSIFMGTLYKDQLEYIDRTVIVAPSMSHYAAFRPDEYKANRQMRMSAEAKRILQKHPDERTDKEVEYAAIALRSIESISGYPIRMQRQLARYGAFESYGSKRILVKQGHAPNAFYFILFGTVLVAVQPDDVQDAKTVVTLERGETFGELAIMNEEARQSTVITQDYVELLSIDTWTYQRLFMVGGQKNINDPDHNAFIQSLIFLRGWPTQKLQNNSDHVRFCYTRRGDVIIHDSNIYKWIVVVKSGSVQVLKKLLRTNSTLCGTSGMQERVMTERQEAIEFLDKPEQMFVEFERARSRVAQQRLLSLQNEETFDDFDLNDETATTITVRTATSAKTTSSRGSRRPKLLAHPRPLDSMTRTKQSRSKAHSIHGVRPSTVCASVKPSSEPTPSVGRMSSAQPPKRTSGLAESPSRDDTPRVSKRESDLAEAIGRAGRTMKGKRTFLHDLDAAYFSSVRYKTPEDERPEFVHVHTLTKGDSFGLHEMLFPDQPSLCLVSNGAECIFIKKKFYEKHASEELIEDMKREVCPYPDQSKFQTDLQTVVNWKAYKQFLLDQFATEKSRKKHLKLWMGTM